MRESLFQLIAFFFLISAFSIFHVSLAVTNTEKNLDVLLSKKLGYEACSHLRLHNNYFLVRCTSFKKLEVGETKLLIPREELQEVVMLRGDEVIPWVIGETKNFQLPEQALLTLKRLYSSDILRYLQLKTYSKALYPQNAEGTFRSTFLKMKGCELPIALRGGETLAWDTSDKSPSIRIHMPERIVSIGRGKYFLNAYLTFSLMSSPEKLEKEDYSKCYEVKELSLTYCKGILSHAMGKAFSMDRMSLKRNDCFWNITIGMSLSKISSDQELPSDEETARTFQKLREEVLRRLNITLIFPYQ